MKKKDRNGTWVYQDNAWENDKAAVLFNDGTAGTTESPGTWGTLTHAQMTAEEIDDCKDD